MDPITMMLLGSLISGGASLFSSFMGANEQDKTNRINQDINNQNYELEKDTSNKNYELQKAISERNYQLEKQNSDRNWEIAQQNRFDQSRARNDAIGFAEQLRNESHMGGTDAEGNTSRFVPGQGWVSTYGTRPNALLDHFYDRELPALRSNFERDDDADRRNGTQAEATLDQFNREAKLDPQAIENMLFEASTRGIGEQTRETTETALRHALRTGQDAGDLVGGINRGAAKQRGDAALDSRLQARDYVDDKFNSERSQLADLYAMFSGKAAGGMAPSFDPTGMDTNPLMGQFMNMAMNNDSGLRNAMGAPVVTMPMRGPVPQQPITLRPTTFRPLQQPNDAWASAVGSVGEVASGLTDRLGGYQMQQQNNALLNAFLTGGGQLDLGRGGTFGAMADRVRTTGGGF